MTYTGVWSVFDVTRVASSITWFDFYLDLVCTGNHLYNQELGTFKLCSLYTYFFVLFLTNSKSSKNIAITK